MKLVCRLIVCLLVSALLVAALSISPSPVSAQSGSTLAQQLFSPPVPLIPSPVPMAETVSQEVESHEITGTPLIPSYLGSVIANAVAKGVSIKVLVFLLLLPAVATLIAFSRHVIGLTGFTIFAPAGLAIVLLSMGIIPGIAMFFLMLVISSIGKWAISFLRLEYIPRTAMLFWSVSVGLFVMLLVSSMIPAISIQFDMFPILLLVLLAEDFMALQAGLKWRLVLERSLQIMFLSVIGAIFMRNLEVQKFALINPEITIVVVAVINILIGRYLGLRLTEYFRFRPLIDAEE